MTRRIASVLFALIVLTGCFSLPGCSAPPLDPAFEEEAVLTAAQDMAALLHARDYAAASSTFSDALLAAIPADTLAGVFDPIFDRLGAFQQVKKSLVYGATDDASGQVYAVSILVMQYENGSAQLTLSFDPSYQLIGIYIK